MVRRTRNSPYRARDGGDSYGLHAGVVGKNNAALPPPGNSRHRPSLPQNNRGRDSQAVRQRRQPIREAQDAFRALRLHRRFSLIRRPQVDCAGANLPGGKLA